MGCGWGSKKIHCSLLVVLIFRWQTNIKTEMSRGSLFYVPGAQGGVKARKTFWGVMSIYRLI